MSNPFTNINEFGKKLLFLIFLLSLVGCASSAKIQHTEIKEPIEVSPEEESKPLQFKEIVVKLDIGEDIGSLQATRLCMATSDLFWKGGRFGYVKKGISFYTEIALSNVRVSTDDFTKVFQDEMENANYNIMWDTGVLFEDPYDIEAEYLIAGIVIEMQANLCFWTVCGEWLRKGEVYMKVNWQLYSRLDRKVVYETITEGTSKVEIKGTSNAEPTGMTDIFLNAFASATKNLLAERGFHDLLVQTE